MLKASFKNFVLVAASVAALGSIANQAGAAVIAPPEVNSPRDTRVTAKKPILAVSVLSRACGKRKREMPFTETELQFMVKVGTVAPSLNDEVCRVFLTTEKI